MKLLKLKFYLSCKETKLAFQEDVFARNLTLFQASSSCKVQELRKQGKSAHFICRDNHCEGEEKFCIDNIKFQIYIPENTFACS